MKSLVKYNNDFHGLLTTVNEPVPSYSFTKGESGILGYKPILNFSILFREAIIAFNYSGTTTSIMFRSTVLPDDTSVYGSIFNEIDFLEIGYRFINPFEIKAKLLVDINVLFSLSDLLIEIIKRFGNVKPALELVSDVEFPEWKTYFISIPNNLEFEEANEKLTDLLQNYLFNQPHKITKKITISIL